MGSGQALVSNKRYRRLFVARTISNVGNGITPIALAFGVLALPGATPTSLSVVLAAQAVPLILVLPLGGVFGDRFGRARVIAAGDLVITLVVGAMALAFLTGMATVALLGVLAFLVGILNALWYPAFTGVVPDVVPDEHLQPANAYISVASNAGLIIGNALGGLLVAAVGSGWAIAVDALTFLIAGLLVLSFRDASQPYASGESMLGDLRSGWRVFVSFQWVVVIVGAFSVLVMGLRGAEAVMGPVLALEEYGGAKGWALVLAMESLGLLVGALGASRVRVARPMLFGMLVLFTLPLWLMALAFALPLWLICVGAFAWGASIELFAVLWYTALQTNVPREALSRVSSYDAMGSLMLGPLGLALAGPLIAAVGLQSAFLIAAAVTAAAILAGLAFRSVRQQGTTLSAAAQDPTAPGPTAPIVTTGD